MNLSPEIRALFCALTVAVIAGCGADIESGIESAGELVYQKQYVEAERLYRKLLKRLENTGELDETESAQHLHVLDRLGRLNALYLHDYPQAVADYRALVGTYPDTDQALAAYITLADIYQHKLVDLNRAIDELQALIEQFPNRPEARKAQLQVAQSYFGLKNYEQARREAELLIKRWPNSSEADQARFQIANSYYVQARYTEAIATYELLLDEDTEPSLAALVLFELGNCLQELKQPERALAHFYGALANHPNPLLVQRKIRRVRGRLHNAKPTAGIRLPDYLKTLTSVTSDGTLAPAPRPAHALIPVAGDPPVVSQSSRPAAPRGATASSPSGATEPTRSGSKHRPKAPPAEAAASSPAPEPAAPAPTPAPTPTPEPAPAPAPEAAPPPTTEKKPAPPPAPAPAPKPKPPDAASDGSGAPQ